MSKPGWTMKLPEGADVSAVGVATAYTIAAERIGLSEKQVSELNDCAMEILKNEITITEG